MAEGIGLSIIIVNYNGGELLLSCLASIREHPPDRPFEVIVLDNASADGSGRRAMELHPDLSFVFNEGNVGLSRAFNAGLARSRGEYVLSLDNDTRVLPGALTELVRGLDEHPEAGAVGSRVLNPDLTPQKTARRAPTALNAIFGRRSLVTRWFPNNPLSRRYMMDDHESTERPFVVDWLSAAALLMRRPVLEEVGGFDERFFVYWVDADLCARIRRRGYTILCVPSSRIIHDENLRRSTRRRRSARMVVDFHRGAYLYYCRNHTRSRWSPMAVLALVGLSLRVALLVGFDRVRGFTLPRAPGP